MSATAERSYNGWSAGPNWSVKGGQLEALVVAGEPFSPGVRAGDVAVVLRYLAEQLHARVEPVVRADWHQADDWGYSYRPNVNNPATLSCHASGTAIDYNATRHPNGKRGTFSAAQVREARRILAELGGVVGWGGDFPGTADEMHWEITGTVAAVKAVADRLRAPAGAPATLREGDTGDLVAKVQAWAVKRFPAYAKIDLGPRRYGPQTVAFVREFQKRKGVTGPDADGTIIGPRTWAAILDEDFTP